MKKVSESYCPLDNCFLVGEFNGNVAGYAELFQERGFTEDTAWGRANIAGADVMLVQQLDSNEEVVCIYSANPDNKDNQIQVLQSFVPPSAGF
ncbi:MAG: hypothetical protein CL565_01085 [Alphaproteobacteria bacterium]|nr:hypothetical protein [Alphaproteobacteria bacterium]